MAPRSALAELYGVSSPLKMVTEVTGTVFSWIDAVLVPLPVAPTRLPVPPVTVQESTAVPWAVSMPQSTPSPARETWSPALVVRVDARDSEKQSGAGALEVSTVTTMDSEIAPRIVA